MARGREGEITHEPLLTIRNYATRWAALTTLFAYSSTNHAITIMQGQKKTIPSRPPATNPPTKSRSLRRSLIALSISIGQLRRESILSRNMSRARRTTSPGNLGLLDLHRGAKATQSCRCCGIRVNGHPFELSFQEYATRSSPSAENKVYGRINKHYVRKPRA